MAKEADEVLLNLEVADASKFYRFYLNQEKKILGTIAVVLFLIVWELVGNVYQLINPMFMSAPSLIAKAGVELSRSGEIWNDLYVSGVEFAWGFALSVVVGIPFGIGIGWYKKMAYIFDPFINAMNATPRVALLPLIIIWLGIGILSKIGIIFIGSVFPLTIKKSETRRPNLLTPLLHLSPATGEDHHFPSLEKRGQGRFPQSPTRLTSQIKSPLIPLCQGQKDQKRSHRHIDIRSQTLPRI